MQMRSGVDVKENNLTSDVPVRPRGVATFLCGRDHRHPEPIAPKYDWEVTDPV